MIWLIVNRNTRSIRSFKSREEATETAIALNLQQADHPRFDLWSVDVESNETDWCGYLWRAFGSDFDVSNAWLKPRTRQEAAMLDLPYREAR